MERRLKFKIHKKAVDVIADGEVKPYSKRVWLLITNADKLYSVFKKISSVSKIIVLAKGSFLTPHILEGLIS